MKVGKGAVVGLDYKLHLGDGKVIDESLPDDPLYYLHGQGQIVPGLEKALEGMEAGQSKQAQGNQESAHEAPRSGSGRRSRVL